MESVSTLLVSVVRRVVMSRVINIHVIEWNTKRFNRYSMVRLWTCLRLNWIGLRFWFISQTSSSRKKEPFSI